MPGERDGDIGPVAARLMERKRVGPGDLDRARQLLGTSGSTIEAMLSRMGLVSDTELAATMAEVLKFPLATAADMPATPPLRDRVGVDFLRNSHVVPLRDTPSGLDLAMADPRDDFAVNALRMIVHKPIRRHVAALGDIERALDRWAAPAAGVAATRRATGEDFDLVADATSNAPAIAFVQKLISDAVRRQASDIHIEPIDGGLEIRLRIDGRLIRVDDPPAHLADAVLGRVKVLARLDVAERRLPQDGRVRVAVDGREIDVRISTVPAMAGESIALRILDRSHLTLDVEALGFAGPIAAELTRLGDRPHGIILVTGPTGSGKTTTLYAMLSRLSRPEVKVLTVEDPVEFRLAGISQVQVQHGIGLGFARVMRSFLRHDPDIMMVGEIRDGETARIAIQASLTGHLILSTLHTNDAPGAVTRLMDMGIESFLISATVNGILAQRLVRTLCTDCRESRPATPTEKAYLKESLPDAAPPDALWHARGCPRCNGSGYRGRVAIGELLVMDDEVKSLVSAGAGQVAIRDAALRKGMTTLRGDALRHVTSGLTSLEEVTRVLPES